MLVRKKNRDKLSEEQAVSVERARLVVVAAAAGSAASAAASATVPPSSELVGCGVPSVSAVADVETALILGVARDESVAAPAASRIVGAVAEAASATGTGSRGGGR
jgi:hypothetical protein